MSERNPEVAGQSGAVDTHCHLFLMDSEPSGVVEAARAAGFDRLICVGVVPETSRRSLELADSAVVHHRHPITEHERFLLVVRDEHRRDTQVAQEAVDFAAHLDAQ